MRLLWPILVLLAACKGPSGPDDGVVTWYGDAQPVVYRVCANCHTQNGIGPGDFTTYEGVKLYAPFIEDALLGGEMPPPVSDPQCHGYTGDDHLSITDEERALLVEFVQTGLAEGDPAEALGDFEPYFEHLDDADRVLELPVEHTVDTDNSGNQYRCFVVDYVPEEDFSITAFDVHVDNPEVVHHMLLFRDPNHDAGAGYGVEPGTTSFDCMDPIMESDWEPLHAWAPGMPPTVLADGIGLKIEQGDQLVIQMHYFDDGTEPQTDRSAYALRTTTANVGQVYMFPGALTSFHIPAGDPEYTHAESFGLSGIPFSIDLHGVFPHMHLLGTHYEASIRRSDDTEDCVVRGDWDFDHQMAYIFDEPIRLDPGDTVTGSCTWDNSADNPNQVHDPPQAVTWGEGTDDEMCVFLLYASLAR